MSDQNGNWFDQNPVGAAPSQPVGPAPEGQAPTPQPAQAPQPAKNWFDQNPVAAPAEAPSVAAPPADNTPKKPEGFWGHLKASVAGDNSALTTPLGEAPKQEASGLWDVLHGDIKKGAGKIWDANKIDASHVEPGSPAEWTIRQFDPDFHGTLGNGWKALSTSKETQQAQAALDAKNPNALKRNLLDIGQTIDLITDPVLGIDVTDQKKHPIAAALTEVASGFTSPENLAIMASSGGLGLIEKTPQALKALGVLNKIVSGGFGVKMVEGAYEHSQKFRDAMNNGDVAGAEYEFTQMLASGVLSAQAATHVLEGTPLPGYDKSGKGRTIQPLTEGITSPTDRAVGKAIGDVVGKATDNVSDFARQKTQSTFDSMKSAFGVTPEFSQGVTRVANKLGKVAGPEFEKTVKAVEPDLKKIVNDAGDKITSPGTAADAIDAHLRGNIDAPLLQEAGATKDSLEPVVPDFRAKLEDRIDKFMDENPGIGSIEEKDAIKQRLMDRMEQEHDFGNGTVGTREPNLYEAESIRQKLKQYEPNETNGFRAAAYDVANFMREQINESYKAKGVTGVPEARQAEANLIKISEALRAAEGLFGKQEQTGGKIAQLFSHDGLLGIIAGSATALAHFLGGNVVGGAITAATIWKGIRDYNVRDIGGNLDRVKELAGRDPNATATTPDFNGPTSPSAGPNQGNPVAPNMPPRPTPPLPATAPPINHTINGKLAAFSLDPLATSPDEYNAALQQFQDKFARMKQSVQELRAQGKELPEASKPEWDAAVKLHGQIQEALSKQNESLEKENAKRVAKYNSDVKKWEDKNTTEHQKNEALKAQQKDAETAAKVQAEKAQRDAMLADERIAHGNTMQANQPAMEIPGDIDGRTNAEKHGHEIGGHVVAAVAEGLNPIAYLSHLHDDAKEANAAAQVQTDSSGAEEGMKGIEQRVVTHLGGPAYDEVHSGITPGRNTGATGDIREARRILREEGGLTGDDLNKAMKNLYERAKGHVSNVDAANIARINAALREEGLPENLHMSPARMENLVKLLKGAFSHGTTETPTDGGIRTGDTDGGIQEGKPSDAGASGEEQNGPAKGSQPEEARKNSGESAVQREAREFAENNAGSNVRVTQKSFEKTGKVETPAGEEPQTEKSNLSKAKAKDVLDKIAETYGTTDSVEAMRHAHSFILPDGKLVHLEGQTHNDVIAEHGGGHSNENNGWDNRPEFVNKSGAVRALGYQNRAGDNMTFSVPKNGVTPEQADTMNRAASQGFLRNGTLNVERADVSPETKDSLSKQKSFPRPGDVHQMLRDIGAHPEKVEKSNLTASSEDKKIVENTPWTEDEKGLHTLRMQTPDGDHVGDLFYSEEPDGNTARITMSSINPEYRNRGIGKEAYKSAIENAKQQGFEKFKSDTTVSNDAQHVWDSLIRDGKYDIKKSHTGRFNANGGGGVEYTVDLKNPAVEKLNLSQDGQTEELAPAPVQPEVLERTSDPEKVAAFREEFKSVMADAVQKLKNATTPEEERDLVKQIGRLQNMQNNLEMGDELSAAPTHRTQEDNQKLMDLIASKRRPQIGLKANTGVEKSNLKNEEEPAGESPAGFGRLNARSSAGGVPTQYYTPDWKGQARSAYDDLVRDPAVAAAQLVKKAFNPTPEGSHFVPATPEEHRAALDANPQGATLATETAPEMANHKIFKQVTPEGKETGVQYHITPQGEAGGLINNGPYTGATAAALKHAQANGATHANSWDIGGALPKLYEKNGLVKTNAVPYDAETYGPPPENLKNAWKAAGWKEGDPYPSVQNYEFPKNVEKSNLTPAEEEEGFQFGKNTEGTPDQQKGLISTRQPSGKGATEDALKQDLTIGRSAIENATGTSKGKTLSERVADKIRDIPGIKIGKNITDPSKVMDSFVKQVSDNLVELHNRVSPEKRAATAKWYESAHGLADQLAQQYGKTVKQMAATIAAMSPQKDWDMNVGLARRVADIYHTKADVKFTPEMEAKSADLTQEIQKEEGEEGEPTYKNEALKGMMDRLRGKSLNELTDPVEKAAWIRLYDEAHNDRSYQHIDPGTGADMGPVMGAKAPAKIAWGSLNQIANGISVLDDGSRENISNHLGDSHKVRNFYNNILDPDNPAGHVTIDTHAVAAALWRALSGKSDAVKFNFGGLGSKQTGAKGMYGLYADAYRDAASRLGIQPRQLQSIVWEEIRDMFPEPLKGAKNKATGEQTHVAAIDNIWKDYQAGNLTKAKAFEAITNYAQKVRDQFAAKKPLPAGKTQNMFEGFTGAPSKFVNLNSPIGGMAK